MDKRIIKEIQRIINEDISIIDAYVETLKVDPYGSTFFQESYIMTEGWVGSTVAIINAISKIAWILVAIVAGYGLYELKKQLSGLFGEVKKVAENYNKYLKVKNELDKKELNIKAKQLTRQTTSLWATVGKYVMKIYNYVKTNIVKTVKSFFEPVKEAGKYFKNNTSHTMTILGRILRLSFKVGLSLTIVVAVVVLLKHLLTYSKRFINAKRKKKVHKTLLKNFNNDMKRDAKHLFRVVQNEARRKHKKLKIIRISDI